MKIKGTRIVIDKLRVEDVFAMRNWGNHENPLLEDYDFPDMNDHEIKIWYMMKTSNPLDRYFSIKDNDGILIGYMGMKSIKIFRRFSTLGLVLDPAKMNQGYGTEVLEVFLSKYFTEMKMKKMILEVSAFNKRAYRLYEKMGFKKNYMYKEEFFDQYLNFSDPYYQDEKDSFEIIDGKLYNYIYRMTLTKKRFLELQETGFRI